VYLATKIYLEGTTLEEIERHHRETLTCAIKETNEILAKHEQNQYEEEAKEHAKQERHKQHVSEDAKRITFD
jgi:hypothetical protein